jgi:hypothetical protein
MFLDSVSSEVSNDEESAGSLRFLTSLSRFRWPLLEDAESFRILTLSPGTGNENLCEFLERDQFRNCPTYEAISYVWGDPTPADIILLSDPGREDGCQGHPISENLSAALHRFRHSSEERLLWVDALCID